MGLIIQINRWFGILQIDNFHGNATRSIKMINFMSNQVPSQRSYMSTNGGRSIVVIKQENIISMQNSDHSQTVSTCPTYSWLISVKKLFLGYHFLNGENLNTAIKASPKQDSSHKGFPPIKKEWNKADFSNR